MVFNLCTSSYDALYLYYVLWKYLKGFKSFSADTISKLKFSQVENSVKYKWSYGSCSLHIAWWCFIFLPKSMKISQRFQSNWAVTISKGNNSVKTYRWSVGCCSLHMVWWWFILVLSFMKNILNSISHWVDTISKGNNSVKCRWS